MSNHIIGTRLNQNPKIYQTHESKNNNEMVIIVNKHQVGSPINSDNIVTSPVTTINSFFSRNPSNRNIARVSHRLNKENKKEKMA